uniref:Uncharacterized protein n=1 Tax=Mucochytrium quahogii TaxID=96639 RepID=A0A7S2W5S2_9STRA|mmetsp:Transcript_6742/g.10669  ORF Transcript_6742/g.10669 Transcript_6742/m.10669 type:complete len:199 (+) Transcript_6742:247-843(+)
MEAIVSQCLKDVAKKQQALDKEKLKSWSSSILYQFRAYINAAESDGNILQPVDRELAQRVDDLNETLVNLKHRIDKKRKLVSNLAVTIEKEKWKKQRISLEVVEDVDKSNEESKKQAEAGAEVSLKPLQALVDEASELSDHLFQSVPKTLDRLTKTIEAISSGTNENSRPEPPKTPAGSQPGFKLARKVAGDMKCLRV